MSASKDKGRAGITAVPEKSGGWGWLLPAPSDRSRSSIDAFPYRSVVEITPACLRLTSSVENMRGIAASAAIVFGLAMAFIALNFAMIYDVADRGYGGPYLLVVGGGAALALLGLWIGYRIITRPLQDTTIISRRLRRIYAWNQRTGWVGVDYDRAVAFVSNFKAVTPTGASSSYPLGVVELVPGSRRIARFVAPTRAYAAPQTGAAIWEFIRRYMDDTPAEVPPVVLTPDHSTNAFAWMDRELYPDMIDRQHHLTNAYTAFGFWFFSGVYYLPNWMEYWIRRYARRPALPSELAAALKWEGENPYRILPPTPEETLAMQGKLPHMKKRWLRVSVWGILLWSFLPLAFVGVSVAQW